MHTLKIKNKNEEKKVPIISQANGDIKPSCFFKFLTMIGKSQPGVPLSFHFRPVLSTWDTRFLDQTLTKHRQNFWSSLSRQTTTTSL